VDDDSDGALDADEIDVTIYLCEGASGSGEIWLGDVEIADADDAAALEGFETIIGTLTITLEETVSLPDLRAVSALRISDPDTSNAASVEVDLPNLAFAPQLLLADAALSAPGLEHAEDVTLGGAIADLDFLAGITTLDSLMITSAVLGDTSGVTALASVSSQIYVQNSTAMRFDALVDVGTLYAYYAAIDAPALVTADVVSAAAGSISVPELVSVNILAMSDGTLEGGSLESVSTVELYGSLSDADILATVTSIPGAMTLWSLDIADERGLAALASVETLSVYGGEIPAFPGLTAVDLMWLEGTTASELSGFSAVRTLGVLYVGYNASLADVSDLHGARVTGPDAGVFVYDNTTLCDSAVEALITATGATTYSTAGNQTGC
jgi:hypothetical protein